MYCQTHWHRLAHVLLVICDQGSNNRSLFETKLHVTTEQPYFVMSEKKIFVLYDPPHLVKNARNLLKRHGFQVGDKHVSWDHIQDFYQADSSLPIRMAPKLTSRRVHLPPFAPLRVKLATEVLLQQA